MCKFEKQQTHPCCGGCKKEMGCHNGEVKPATLHVFAPRMTEEIADCEIPAPASAAANSVTAQT